MVVLPGEVEINVTLKKITLLCLLLLPLAALASGYQQGAAAYRNGNYQAALQIWKPLAKAGNARARFGMGLLYSKGRGVEQNQATASHWYQKAARQGNAGAQYNLGVRCQNGRGVPKDLNKAVHWYGKAAAQGQPAAQNNLALLYARGLGVPKNRAKAAGLLFAAARAGNDSAEKNVAILMKTLPARYVNGSNVNVRSGPGLDDAVTGVAGPNTRVGLLDTRQGWSRVALPRQARLGWIKSSFLATKAGTHAPGKKRLVQHAAHNKSHAPPHAQGRQMQVAGSHVNVRSGPGTASSIVTQASRHTAVHVLDQKHGWSRVKLDSDNTTGWIASRLLVPR